LFGQARGKHLADDAVEDDVGRVADDLRPGHGESHAPDPEDRDDAEQRQLRAQPAEKLAQRLAGVLDLRGRRPAHPHPTTWLATLSGLHARTTSRPVDQATASPTCDAAISR